MTAPEIRYRRLLALYPRDFRQEYGDEMLAVLMADRRPGLAQGADVVRGAVAAHFRGLWSGEGRAARVVQIFGAMLLVAVALRRVVVEVRITLFHYDEVGFRYLEAVNLARLVGWGIVLAAAILGWRLLGVAGASAGLAGEILAPSRFYLDTPATVLNAYWLIVAAVLVLIAGLVAERGTALPRGWQWVAAGGVVLSLSSALPFPFFLGAYEVRWVPVLIAALVAAVALTRQEPELRARLVCWAAPVLVTIPLVQWGFADFIRYNGLHPESTRLIGPLQWAVLVLVPAATFVGASLLNRRGLSRSAAQPQV